ncbi:hypothetical protein TSAR_006195, partial [Trichomalopsis sarcophagae]
NMAPNSVETETVRDESPKSSNAVMDTKQKSGTYFRGKIRWQTTIVLAAVHALAVYGLLTFPYLQSWKTLLWAYFVAMYTMIGINGGVHRLWCHKSFKANVPLRMILAWFYLTAAQVSFKKWVQYHRCHHRYMETDADPHNSQRGFFFSHIGWLMIQKTPETRKRLKEVDLSDMEADPVIRFCDKYYVPLAIAVQVFSVLVPVYGWNESWKVAILSQAIRYAYTLNAMFSINSFAHMWGYKPYDKNIAPVENRWTSYVSFGEGWHNYHHTFPYDYRTPEIGGPRFDVVAWFIALFGMIGWAYDLKKPSPNLVQKTMNNKGDGTFMKAAVS